MSLLGEAGPPAADGARQILRASSGECLPRLVPNHATRYRRLIVSAKKEYTVVLEGVEALDLSIALLRDLCDLLIEGAQRCARLVAEGRSVARGTAPAWVGAAADCRVTRFAPGSLDLGVTASKLSDAAPELFSQQQLFPTGTDSDATALDLFLDAAEDAAAGRRDSERLDAGVLEVLARTGNLFAKGASRLRVSRAGHANIVLDTTSVGVIRALAEETPPASISRIQGVLDALTVSTKAITLRLDDGHQIRGFAGAVDLERLRTCLGAKVVVEGSINFRPSGEALRVEVDSLTVAGPGDVIWAQLPRGESVASRPRPSSTGFDLDALFGRWPGEEDDARLAQALRDLQ